MREENLNWLILVRGRPAGEDLHRHNADLLCKNPYESVVALQVWPGPSLFQLKPIPTRW